MAWAVLTDALTGVLGHAVAAIELEDGGEYGASREQYFLAHQSLTCALELHGVSSFEMPAIVREATTGLLDSYSMRYDVGQEGRGLTEAGQPTILRGRTGGFPCPALLELSHASEQTTCWLQEVQKQNPTHRDTAPGTGPYPARTGVRNPHALLSHPQAIKLRLQTPAPQQPFACDGVFSQPPTTSGVGDVGCGPAVAASPSPCPASSPLSSTTQTYPVPHHQVISNAPTRCHEAAGAYRQSTPPQHMPSGQLWLGGGTPGTAMAAGNAMAGNPACGSGAAGWDGGQGQLCLREAAQDVIQQCRRHVAAGGSLDELAGLRWVTERQRGRGLR